MKVINPKNELDKWRQARAERPKELALNYGEQDEIDILSYSGLEEHVSYLRIDDQYVRTLFIAGYPFVASSGWLNNLINFNHNADISYHLAHVDARSEEHT